jgi:effector-binding domain-containing protein
MGEVRTVHVSPRSLAAASAPTTRARLAGDIRRLLDQVWPVLRDQKVATGLNVVVYRGNPLTIDAGVEVLSAFEETDVVRRSATPAGEAVTTTHWGTYSEMRSAYQALEDWANLSGRSFGDVSWEVYGHWSDDPSKLRTDIFRLLDESPRR